MSWHSHQFTKGVGTGGTSAILTVSDSNNTSCLPKAVSIVQFYFYLHPETITLCDPVNITWDPTQGSVYLSFSVKMKTDLRTIET